MQLDDVRISRLIIERFSGRLLECLESDVAIVGAGPAGLVAAYYLACEGRKVVVFERKLAVGGGMWGGGVMFNEIVVQEESRHILDEFGIGSVPSGDGYFCASAIEAVSTLCSKAVKAGAEVFNLMSAEDVMIVGDRVTGLVINWTPVELARLMVDPISVRAKYVVDATGHSAEIASVIQRKSGCKLLTETGGVVGEKPLCADLGERMTVENTKEVFPGVYVAGMSCNAVFGAPRMGPIFGGMLMSGRKVAQLISSRLG